MKQEAIKELRRTMSTLGVAEAELAWKKISGKGLTNIPALIEAMRTEVRAFRDAHIPANAAFSSEEWNRLYREIDQSASRELSSSVDRAISELESQRKQIDAEIIRQQTAIEQSHNEFYQIKERASNLKAKYAGYAQHRNELATAEADYESLYENYCRGVRVNPQGFIGLVEMIISRPMRLKVLAKLETEAKAAIVSLQKRNRELAKELNLDPHSI